MVTSHSNDGAIRLSLDTPSSHAPLDGFPEPPAWMADAVCATTDPEAFFPEKGGSTREAKAVCRSCIVQAECLDWALDNDERFGIWGGLSERERRRIKPATRTNWATPNQGDIREWAMENGIRVADTGSLPRSVVEQYEAAQIAPPAIHEESA